MPQITIYDDNIVTILNCSYWEISDARENIHIKRILTLDFIDPLAKQHMDSIDSTFLPINIELMDYSCFHYMATNAVILDHSNINDTRYGTDSFTRYTLACYGFYNIEENNDNHYWSTYEYSGSLHKAYREDISTSFKIMLNKIVEEI